jgi:hypothetical protein
LQSLCPTIEPRENRYFRRLDMDALKQLNRSEQVTGAAGILLLIGIFAFPWYHVGVASVTVDGQTFGGASYSGNVLQGPGSFFSILALIVLIALLAELAVNRFTSVELPRLPIPWTTAELCGAAAVLALLVIKILFHIGNFGWGFYADMVLAVALAYGATGLARAHAASPAHAAAQPGN